MTVMLGMEFGIFHEFWSTRAGSQAEAFADSFAQIQIGRAHV